MPTIDISLKDLENLTGKKLPKNEDQLNDTLMLAKTEVENILGDEIKINIEDSNRPDLWCVEGLARELKGALGIETGLKKYQINKSDYEVNVNKRLILVIVIIVDNISFWFVFILIIGDIVIV